MPITNPTTDRRSEHGWLPGPRAAFLGSTVFVVLCLAFPIRALPKDFVAPAVVTLLFVLAATFAIIAYVQRRTNTDDVTYADVAGALTFIGICLSALIAPDQMARIVEGAYGEN